MALQSIRALLIVLAALTAAECAAAGEQDASTLRVAAAQIPVTRDVTANSEAIHRALDVAIREKADILLTPEGSLSGYTHQFDQSQVAQQLAALIKRASKAPRKAEHVVVHTIRLIESR